MSNALQSRLIIEILGRPASNVTDALNGLVDKMSKEKGVKILEKTVHPPVPVKDSKDLFTSFAEILIECEDTGIFFSVVFAYMPANIEIIQPEGIELKNSEISALANKIIQRLHGYDAITRRLLIDNQNLKKKLGLIPDSSQPAQTPSQTPPQKQVQETPKIQSEKPKDKKSEKQSRKSKKKSLKKNK